MSVKALNLMLAATASQCRDTDSGTHSRLLKWKWKKRERSVVLHKVRVLKQWGTLDLHNVVEKDPVMS